VFPRSAAGDAPPFPIARVWRPPLRKVPVGPSRQELVRLRSAVGTPPPFPNPRVLRTGQYHTGESAIPLTGIPSNRGFFGTQFLGLGFDPVAGVYWDDYQVPLTRDKQGQASKPDYDFTEHGLLFPQNDPTEIVYITLQMKHAMVIGTPLRPHVHYVQDGAAFPVFKMDYRWYENGGDPTGAFTTLTASSFAFAYVAGSILQIAIFPEIDGSHITSVSSVLDVKLYRDDNVVAGDVLTKEFDMHYQTDGRGSLSEYTK